MHKEIIRLEGVKDAVMIFSMHISHISTINTHIVLQLQLCVLRKFRDILRVQSVNSIHFHATFYTSPFAGPRLSVLSRVLLRMS